ncbi:MAG: FKBP-type peptidyl-prolyl cis-trans isomerase [Bacteroidales bacterium]|jgi:FKBP-type peptidyl-prolyl cis-trans isomerase|nr:FKBP-type peptidyl-prolyl cis-trans isomerase [Bacteroidales bacterium]
MDKLLSIKPILIFLIFFVMVSCRNGNEPRPAPDPPDRKDLENINIYLVQKDREIIQSYIARKKIKMAESESGLWFLIVKKGEGEYIKENDTVVFDYKCSLLDGTLCYSSEADGQKEIILGRSGLEAGLEEGLRLLKPGGEAVFILPPFLGYGLLGDQKKIPARATLVYEINIVKVN